ncbi:hypothetical protein VPH219E481_0025 [Vibrio phage 219E48-1]
MFIATSHYLCISIIIISNLMIHHEINRLISAFQ